MGEYVQGAEADRAGLPVRGFLYTLDQVAFVLNIDVRMLDHHVRLVGVPSQSRPRNPATGESPSGDDKRMKAVSLRPSTLHDKEVWRVPEAEVIRYLKHLGLVVYERKFRL